MKPSICGADCPSCPWNAGCPGCSEEVCFIARYIKTNGKEKYEVWKQNLITEFNALCIPDLPKISELYALVGKFVNLEYPLPNGKTVKFLDDNSMYLGNQVECGEGRCYGLVAGLDFLLVAQYGENAADPQIVLYKRR